MEVQQKNISYLRARDPSIIAWNRPRLAHVRLNLKEELDDIREEKTSQQEDNHVQVYLRIKSGVPFKSLYKIQNDTTLICKIPEGSYALRNAKYSESVSKKYSFSKIFGPDTTQIDVFDYIVKPKMLDFINGNNCTLLTYGASGSGKTFTIVGTDEKPGLIPRALEYLFRTIPQLSEAPTVKPLANGNVVRLNGDACKEERQNRVNMLQASSSTLDRAHIRTYKAMQQRLSGEPAAILEQVEDVSLAVWVSFAEIYNEQIYDLLQPDPVHGKQRPKLRLGSSNGNTYVKNLSTVSVRSGLEAFQVLQYGIHNLNYAATSINSHSSRSHSIFTIRLAQASNFDSGIGISHFNFCDLAGCERSKKTMNVGDRLKESNNINTSLLVLGRCIKAVRGSQKQNDHRLVPFRESKLTQLFQKALSGLETISMIVNMNPSLEMFDESHHVLNFSAVAKNIVIEQEVKDFIKPTKPNRFSQYMEHMENKEPILGPVNEDAQTLRAMVSQLQRELEEQKAEHEVSHEIRVNELVSGYREMLKAAEDNQQMMIEATERKCKAYYQIKLNTLQDHYERLMEQNAKRPAIINLDSDEEDVEELQKQLNEKRNAMREQQQTISSLQQDLTALSFKTKVESNELRDKLEALTAEKELLKAKIAERERTLKDALSSYKNVENFAKESEMKVWQLLADKLNLEETVTELIEQLDLRTVMNNEDDSEMSSQPSRANGENCPSEEQNLVHKECCEGSCCSKAHENGDVDEQLSEKTNTWENKENISDNGDQMSTMF